MKTVGHYKEQKIGLDAFHMDHTYGGFLFFSKDDLPTINQRIIHDDIKKTVQFRGHSNSGDTSLNS